MISESYNLLGHNGLKELLVNGIPFANL
jgi:hypothetical protein